MRRARGTAAAVVGLLSLAACDAILVDPEPIGRPLEVRLALTELAGTSAALGDLTGALGAVRYAHFQLSRGGEVRDTVVPARVDGDVVSTRLAVRAAEVTGWLEIQAELLTSNRLPLFRGHVLLDAHDLAPQVGIDLYPVAFSISVVMILARTALADTIPLVAVASFANATQIPGAEFEWTTLDPSVAEVISGARLVTRSNGATALRASTLGTSRDFNLVVRQDPVALTGVGPADTTVAVGATFRARAYGEDRNGLPLLPGADVDWSARGVVSVDDMGLVTAQSVGTGFVDATHGSVVYTAQVTVTP